MSFLLLTHVSAVVTPNILPDEVAANSPMFAAGSNFQVMAENTALRLCKDLHTIRVPPQGWRHRYQLGELFTRYS